MEQRQAPAALLDDLPRGVRGKRPDRFKGYEARFMDAEDFQDKFGLCQLGYDVQGGRGFLAGMFEGLPVGVEDDRHIMTIAGSRTGKGVSVIIPNLLTYCGSVLVMDPKGENADITARRRADLGQEVRILDPFNVVLNPWLIKSKARYNPLAALNPNDESLISDVGVIGDALVVIKSDQKDPHWDESAKNFVQGVILHVVTFPAYTDRINLVTVRHLLSHGVEYTLPDNKRVTGMAGLCREMEDNNHTLAGEVVQAAAYDMIDRSEGEASGILSSARRHTAFLDLPELQRVLQGNDFHLADLKRQPMSLYVCVPASKFGLCARWMRLFVNQTLVALERPDIPKPTLPVRMILDEMPVLGHMQQLEDAAGQMAGFGLQMHGILQDLGQLQELYKGRWETFLGNSGVIQFFGNSDLSTLKWITERLGKTTIEIVQEREVAAAQRQAGLTGQERQRATVDLLTLDETARYFARSDDKRRCLVVQPDTGPLILQRYDYRADTLFKGLYDARIPA